MNSCESGYDGELGGGSRGGCGSCEDTAPSFSGITGEPQRIVYLEYMLVASLLLEVNRWNAVV